MTSSIVPKRDIPESVHSSYDEDLDLIRSTLRSLLHSGEEGLRMAQDLAEESEHPRAIEVLTGNTKRLMLLKLKVISVMIPNLLHKMYL
jgi:hypothetical protein